MLPSGTTHVWSKKAKLLQQRMTYLSHGVSMCSKKGSFVTPQLKVDFTEKFFSEIVSNSTENRVNFEFFYFEFSFKNIWKTQ